MSERTRNRLCFRSAIQSSDADGNIKVRSWNASIWFGAAPRDLSATESAAFPQVCLGNIIEISGNFETIIVVFNRFIFNQ